MWLKAKITLIIIYYLENEKRGNYEYTLIVITLYITIHSCCYYHENVINKISSFSFTDQCVLHVLVQLHVLCAHSNFKVTHGTLEHWNTGTPDTVQGSVDRLCRKSFSHCIDSVHYNDNLTFGYVSIYYNNECNSF